MRGGTHMEVYHVSQAVRAAVTDRDCKDLRRHIDARGRLCIPMIVADDVNELMRKD